MPSMPAVPLRLATANDFAAIAAITNHYIRTTTIHFGNEDVTDEELRTAWKEHEDLYAVVVAECLGEVVAYAKAGAWRTRAAYRWTPETGVYVRHDCLGQSLGRAVYHRLIAVCRAQGFHSLMAGATMPNDASDRLHRDLGFVPVGRVLRAGSKFGAWWDVAFYQLQLASPDAVAGPIRSPHEVWGEASAGNPVLS